MRHLTIIIAIAAAVCAQSIVAERSLSVEVIPPARETTVWDFSNIIADNANGVYYQVFGDSAITEEVHGIRVWYATDQSGFLRAEGILWKIDPDSAVTAGQWTTHTLPRQDFFRATVTRESHNASINYGFLEQKAVSKGTLILPGSDSIPALMSSETLSFGEYHRNIRRWFAISNEKDPALPLAVSVNCGTTGNMDPERAFIANDGIIHELSNTVPDLKSLQISGNGRSLTIYSTSPLTEEVHIDITDINGFSHAHAILLPGEISVSIDLASLPRSTYLAVLSAQGAPTRKVRL
ncbi:MAG: hypothetical protein K2F63_06080 [Muribaculaceae bacterium]|nr:hypothetical protein [Muribaculaceae bacterium]